MKEFSVYDDDDDNGNCQNDSRIDFGILSSVFYTWLYVIEKMKNNNIGEVTLK